MLSLCCTAHAYEEPTRAAFYKGIALAVLVGLAGGSILVPMKLAADAYSGLVFVPSFGFGAALGGPVATALFFACRSPPVVPELYPPIVLPGNAIIVSCFCFSFDREVAVGGGHTRAAIAGY